LQDADDALRGVLDLETGIVQHLHERRGGAVEDGQFGAVEVDDEIVDAKTGAGRHEVFDGGDLDPRLVGDGRAVARLRDVVGVGADGVVHTAHVAAHEHDPGIDGRGRERHAHVCARVDANARTHSRARYSLLTAHQVHPLVPPAGFWAPRPDPPAKAPVPGSTAHVALRFVTVNKCGVRG